MRRDGLKDGDTTKQPMTYLKIAGLEEQREGRFCEYRTPLSVHDFDCSRETFEEDNMCNFWGYWRLRHCFIPVSDSVVSQAECLANETQLFNALGLKKWKRSACGMGIGRGNSRLQRLSLHYELRQSFLIWKLVDTSLIKVFCIKLEILMGHRSRECSLDSLTGYWNRSWKR